ncbi:MAG: hypothetical protein E8D48_08795 [Nitrospira sp.]|nr:MAG: hypothetical protein E8D48_08795 [Nitrospira sp.]
MSVLSHPATGFERETIRVFVTECPFAGNIILRALIFVTFVMIAGVGILLEDNAHAAIRQVSPTGNDNVDCSITACRHIQFAINQAAASDTVLVAAGTYTESITLKTGVHVLSTQSATIQGSSYFGAAWAVQAVQTGPGTILEGFVVTCSVSCGGIFIQDGAAEVRRNDIRNNTNQFVGGGIEVINSTVMVVNNLIRNNQSSNVGGGVAVFNSPSSVWIINNTFSANVAGGPMPNGSHIHLAQSGNVLVQNNIFAGFGGSAAIVASSMTSPPAIKNNLFTGGPVYQDELGVTTTSSMLNSRSFAADNVNGVDTEVFVLSGTDFHLHPAGSLARDLGLAENAPSNDFDGDARPLGAGVDIGFDEIPPGGGMTQCSDGLDNDDDSLIDLADPGCTNSSDNDETNSSPFGATCSSTVNTMQGLQAEVNSVNTSSHTKQALMNTLKRVSVAIASSDRKAARTQLASFIREAVRFSNLKGRSTNRIPINQASHLVCGAANVLTGISVP